MSLTRRNWVLLAVLALLVLAEVATRREGSAGGEDGPLLPELFGVPAWRILIEQGGARAELQREPVEGEQAFSPWSVTGAQGYPADRERVLSLLARLRSLRTLDVVGESADRHGDFGLVDGVQRVTVFGAESVERKERVLCDVAFGQAPGAPEVPYVRRLDGERVVRAAAFPLPSADSLDWLSPEWLPLEAGWVESLTARVRGEAEIVALRAGVDRWQDPEGERIPAAAARELLGCLTGLKPATVVRRGEESLPVELELELGLEGGATQTLRFSGGGQEAVRIGDPWVVGLEEAAYHALLAKVRALSMP